MSLLPNTQAPDFEGKAVIGSEIKTIKLSNYAGKYVILFFYPADFTFVCPTEIIAFSDRVEEFKSRNCEVIACSTDSEFCHLAWTKLDRHDGGLGQMKIPILADRNKKISQAYGVLEPESGNAFRGLFIIDTKSKLRQITVNDMPVGRSVDEALRLLDAFQFVEKHGEVCPINWKPGNKGIKVK